MEATVDLDGVRTWYAVDGAGDPLVYLHGGFSDSGELDPVRARRMVMISGQFHRDGLLPDLFGDDPEAAVAGMAESPQARRYAGVSPEGPEHYPVVAEKIMRMAFEEPRLDVAELAGVHTRTLVAAADDDIVRPEHTIEIYRTIPDAEPAVVPGTSHVLILEKPDLVAQLVLDFLTTDPVPTRIPIRRK